MTGPGPGDSDPVLEAEMLAAAATVGRFAGAWRRGDEHQVGDEVARLDLGQTRVYLLICLQQLANRRD